MNRPGIITACQLAYEARYHTSYCNPAFAQRRTIWDTAWREAERAAGQLRTMRDSIKRGAYDHHEWTKPD